MSEASRLLPPKVQYLAKMICAVHRVHYLAIEQNTIEATDKAEDLHRDLTGKQVDILDPNASREDKDSFAATMMLVRELHGDGNPERHDLLATAARLQGVLEDQLGAILVNDPPAFVTAEIGPPPRPSSTPRVHCRDGRALVGRGEVLTPRRLWERTAGAIAGVTYEYWLRTDVPTVEDAERHYDAMESARFREGLGLDRPTPPPARRAEAHQRADSARLTLDTADALGHTPPLGGL